LTRPQLDSKRCVSPQLDSERPRWDSKRPRWDSIRRIPHGKHIPQGRSSEVAKASAASGRLSATSTGKVKWILKILRYLPRIGWNALTQTAIRIERIRLMANGRSLSVLREITSHNICYVSLG
jgi:hypothetical protein